jgi:hypothetical protein
MTARFSLILGKARGHRPRLQFNPKRKSRAVLRRNGRSRRPQVRQNLAKEMILPPRRRPTVVSRPLRYCSASKPQWSRNEELSFQTFYRSLYKDIQKSA